MSRCAAAESWIPGTRDVTQLSELGSDKDYWIKSTIINPVTGEETWRAFRSKFLTNMDTLHAHFQFLLRDVQYEGILKSTDEIRLRWSLESYQHSPE